MKPAPGQPLLLADDDPDDRFLLQEAIAQAGITVPVAAVEDGQAALDYLSGSGRFTDRAKHPLPFMALLDIKMPLRDGLEVLEWIRSQPELQDLPVIVFTSSPFPDDCRKAYRLKANAFVIKPAQLEKLAEFARCLKGFWLDLAEFPPVGR